MTRVVHLNDKLSMDGRNPSSIAHLLADWIPRLARRGVECSVSTLRDPDPGADHLARAGVRVHRLGRWKYSPGNLAALAALLHREQADIAHLHGFASHDLGRVVSRRLGIANVIHEHATLRVPWHQRLADRVLSGRTDAAIAVSDSVRRFMIRHRSIAADRIVVIGNSVDLDRFRFRDLEARRRTRQALGVPQGTRLVGTVTRLRVEKGTEHLVRAAPAVLARWPDALFVIAGDGPLANELKRLGRELGVAERVRFLGFRSDVPALLAALDVLVIPSLTEGFPLSLVEAMAAGVPVVATRVGGVPEVATDGHNVLLVPPADPEALARRTLEILERPELADRLARAGRETAARFGTDAAVARVEALYRSLVEPGRPAGSGVVRPLPVPGDRPRRTPRLAVLMEDFHPVQHGATTQLLLLGERFAARGLSILVVTRRIERAHPRRESLAGIEVVRVPPAVGLHRAGKFLMIPGALWALFRLRRRFDVLLVSDVKVLGAAGVLAARLLRRRCLLRAESCGELDTTDWLRVNRARHPVLARVAQLLLPLRNLWLRRADRFLSISSAIRREFLSIGVPADRVVDLTNGIDLGRFRPLHPSQKPGLRRRLGLPAGWLVVYTGRLTEGKGLRWLIEIWGGASALREDAHLVLVGSGQGFAADVEAELRRLVHQRGFHHRVTFTGAVRDVEAYLQAADCFVLPSRSEALAISLLEAMACGLPCIATRVGGVPDFLEDGVNGLLVPYRDDDRLVAALAAVAGSPELAAGLAERGRRTVEERFHIDRIVELYAALLREVA
jgi:glycosyltransferase involved in cell wall biosynthesis